MDATPLGSSLSSRSRETSDHIPTSPQRGSFRHRRRTREPFHRSDPKSRHTNRSDPTANHTPKPWHRIRTRLSVMDDLANFPAAAAACVSPPHEPEPEPIASSDFSATVISANTSMASSAAKDKHSGRPRRIMTNSTRKRRSIRTLMPPPRPNLALKNTASITGFLRSASVPVGCAPESVDTAFKAHSSLLRKITMDPFELNRYLFAYKPLAKVTAVLSTALLAVVDIDQKSFPMSLGLRTAALFVSGNAHRNVYVMTFAAQLKSIMKSRPSTEAILPAMVLEGQHLSEKEIAALDFAQEVSSPNATVSESTRRRILDADAESDGRLERLVSGVSAYGSFLSCLTSTMDIELSHAAIQYATNNLQGLPWKSSGAPVNVGFMDDDMADFDSTNAQTPLSSSKYRPKRERLSLTRNYDRHTRDRTTRSRSRGIRRVSQFFTSSLMGPKTLTDVNRITENWMKSANVPPAGQLFDINDEIHALFGFHPFYFSTAAMEGEVMRRAFLFGAKELLFEEKEVSKRVKFIICYVLSSGKERRRILDSDHSRSFEKQGVHNGHSISSVYTTRAYDSLSIMSAHAAFLACKYGATPAELVAASDGSRVRSAMERYTHQQSANLSSYSIGFPLTKRDCAAILIAHSLLQETVQISEVDLRLFESTYGSAMKNNEYSSRPSRRAFLEIIGTASMWSAFERYATGSLAFDIDCSSNMVFGSGRAEPTISEFVQSMEGRKIGLSLSASECRDVTRVRSDSKASRTSSLRPSMKKNRRLYRKRTSSALNTGTRMGRIFASVTSAEAQPNSVIAAM